MLNCVTGCLVLFHSIAESQSSKIKWKYHYQERGGFKQGTPMGAKYGCEVSSLSSLVLTWLIISDNLIPMSTTFRKDQSPIHLPLEWLVPQMRYGSVGAIFLLS